MKEPLSEYHKIALIAAVSASKEIMRVYDNEISIYEKEDGSPVTNADLQSSETIEKILEQTNLPLISEEMIQHDFDIRKNWSKCWCIDPLDGTKEFIQRNGEFAVNIALIENGFASFGIIASPVKQKILFGSRSTGVFISDFINIGRENSWIRLNEVDIVNDPIVVTCSRSHHSGNTLDFLSKLRSFQPNIEFLKMGSSLKFFELALGNADVYPRFARTMEWDIASGQAILEGLGGEVLHANTKEPLTYNKANLANPYFVAKTKAYKQLIND